MGNINTTGRSAANAPRDVPRCRSRGGGLVIVGPTAGPLAGLDELLALPGFEPVEAIAERLASWITVNDEAIELTRQASKVIRNGANAVVFLDAHVGDADPVPPDLREFVCVRLGQIMIGLADTPSFVALHGERMARALILDSLGDDVVDPLAKTDAGFPVWELSGRTMFAGIQVAACPGDRAATECG